MIRLLATTLLLGLAPAQEAPSEESLQKIRRAGWDGQTLEACRLLERWSEWPGFVAEVGQLVSSSRRIGEVERGALLGLLRLHQAKHPQDAQDPEFDGAASRVLGWPFIQLAGRVNLAELKSLGLRATPRQDAAPRSPSVVTAWRIPSSSVEQAHHDVLNDRDNPLPAWRRISRERWSRLGREIVHTDLIPIRNLGINARGLYILEEQCEGLTRQSPLIVSEWAVVAKVLPGEVLVYACRPGTGEPLPDLRLTLRGKTTLHQARTGPDGLARFAIDGAERLLAQFEEEYQELKLRQKEGGANKLVYITTDRPVYRPGQTVSYKALLRSPDGAHLTLPAQEKVKVEVLDPLGRVIHAHEPSWNEHGSVSGSLRLGEEPPIGMYEVVVHIPQAKQDFDDSPALWRRRFTIAAYRKPEMQVRIEFPAEARLGERLRARVRADYYFGGAVKSGEVEWTVLRRIPWVRKTRTPEVDPARAWFFEKTEDYPDWGYAEFATGKGVLREDGTCDVEFDAEESAEYRTLEHEFKVQAVVRDLSRFEAEGEGAILATPAALRLELSCGRRFVRPGTPLEVRVRASMPDGRPIAGQNVELTGYSDTGVRNEAGEVEFEPWIQAKARTGADGHATFTVAPEATSRLRLRARAQDAKGRTAIDRLDLPVESPLFDRDRESDDFLVIPEHDLYQAGDTARLLVSAPRKGLTALLTIEGERFHEARVVRFKSATEALSLPIGADWPTKVLVKLCAWRESTPYGGGATLRIYPKDGILDVAIRADKAVYAPREKARVTLNTGVAAEVEIGIVDESIFAVRKDKTEDIRTFFHQTPERLALWEGTMNLRDYHGEGTGGPLTGAVFALEEAKVGGPGESGEAVRSFFPDTLFWRAHVVTDAEGRAELEVEIPDSLTTWRFTARAVARGQRFGEARSNAVCRKDVMVRLAAPRFLTERDRGTVSTLVHNETREEATFSVRLEAEGLQVEGAAREIRVKAGAAERLDWTVLAPRACTATLRARITGPAGTDAVEIPLPVLPHGLERLDGISGIVDGRWEGSISLPAGALKGSALLESTISSPGISAVLAALPSLAGYPYGCVEQTMSRFLPAVVAAQTLKRLNLGNEALEKDLPQMVAQGLGRLYDFQHEDGGWGWWKTDETHPFMTAYAMYGLLTAQGAGFAIREEVLKNGLARLEELPPSPLGAWVRARLGRPIDTDPDPETEEGRAWLVLAGRRDLAAKLTGRPPGMGRSLDVREAALAIRALVAVDPKDARIPKLVEWLMLQRGGSIWNSTLDTAYAVYALSDLAAGRPEPGVLVRVNGHEVPAPGGRVRVGADLLQPGANRVEVERRGEGLLFASVLLRWRTDEEAIGPAVGQLEVTRRIERLVQRNGRADWEALESGAMVKAGDDLRIVLGLRAQAAEEFVMLEAPLPAGAEAREDVEGAWDQQSWYARRELRDNRVCVAVQHLGADREEFIFRVRPVLPGDYHVMPARAFAMYDPDHQGWSGEFLLRVAP